MNQTLINHRYLYVSRAQNKTERRLELMRKYEAKKMERYIRYSSKCVVVCRFNCPMFQISECELVCEEP